jgi:hypothetical protein
MTIVKNAFFEGQTHKKTPPIGGVFIRLKQIFYTNPCAIIAFATLINPATFAPFT